MTFSFKVHANGSGVRTSAPLGTIDMALESRFEDGSVVQAAYASVNGRRTLVYREATSGKWRNALGLSFNGLPHTPENLMQAIGRRDPVSAIYVVPAT